MDQLPREIIHNIAVHIVDGITWKGMMFTCSRVYSIMYKAPHQSKVTNHLMTLLQLLPDKPWNYRDLSINPNLRVAYVIATPTLDWDYELLSSNECVSVADLSNHRLFTFDHRGLRSNPNVDPRLLLCNRLFGRCMCHMFDDAHATMLSVNFKLTADDILHHPRASWSYYLLSCHPAITLNMMLADPNRGWNYHSAMLNPNITFDMIMEHRELFDETLRKNLYGCQFLSINRSVTIQNVLDHPQLPWNYSHLSRHVNITLQMMLDHPELPWEFDHASANPNITYEMMINHSNIKWCYKYLSLNPTLTYNIVMRNIHAWWNYPYLSLNLFNKHDGDTYSQTVGRKRYLCS